MKPSASQGSAGDGGTGNTVRMSSKADTLLLFGATGDLAQRMLLPSLCALDTDGLLDPALQIIGTARSAMSDGEFRNFARAALEKFLPANRRGRTAEPLIERGDRHAQRLTRARARTALVVQPTCRTPQVEGAHGEIEDALHLPVMWLHLGEVARPLHRVRHMGLAGRRGGVLRRLAVAARVGHRRRVGEAPLVFELLPAEFTLSEFQALLEAIIGRPVDRRNFRRRVLELGLVAETGATKREGAHRPARLFRGVPAAYDRMRERELPF